MLPLVFAAVLGPTAYELYYLGYATSKNCLQIEIITGKPTMRLRIVGKKGTNWVTLGTVAYLTTMLPHRIGVSIGACSDRGKRQRWVEKMEKRR